jgi:hypothetical protein
MFMLFVKGHLLTSLVDGVLKNLTLRHLVSSLKIFFSGEPIISASITLFHG